MTKIRWHQTDQSTHKWSYLLKVLLICLVLVSCTDRSTEKRKRRSSPRVSREVELLLPTGNEVLTPGESIRFSLKHKKDQVIDSVLIIDSNGEHVYYDSEFEWSPQTRQVGTPEFRLMAYVGNKKERFSPKVKFVAAAAPENFTYNIINTYPHDTEAYTQGLLVRDGTFIESTGQNGSSSLRQVNITNGVVDKISNLENQYFGEGCAIWNDHIYQITWRSQTVFVYDMDFNVVDRRQYDGEGWGLTTYQDQLIMSNGSHRLTFLDPRDFSMIRQLEVFDHEKAIDNLNELEMIGGLIYANVYLSDQIVGIDPDTGEVKERIDLSGLLSPEELRRVDVLNGIAYDDNTGQIYVTGKLWPKLFEVEWVAKPPI